eukprot:2071841-Lingulodinium_polyedra.AAC.1
MVPLPPLDGGAPEAAWATGAVEGRRTAQPNAAAAVHDSFIGPEGPRGRPPWRRSTRAPLACA